MKWDHIEGNWKQFKGNVKRQWDRLSDAQLDVIAGVRDQLADSIQQVYGISKHAAEWQLSAGNNASMRLCTLHDDPARTRTPAAMLGLVSRKRDSGCVCYRSGQVTPLPVRVRQARTRAASCGIEKGLVR